MDEILELYARKLDDRGVRVLRRYRNHSQIEGYSGELRQLLANLVVNASDAMAENGVLQVRVASAHQWSDGKEGVRVTVADNGSGISSADLAAHFRTVLYNEKRFRQPAWGFGFHAGLLKNTAARFVFAVERLAQNGIRIFIFLPRQLPFGSSDSPPLSSFSDNNRNPQRCNDLRTRRRVATRL